MCATTLRRIALRLIALLCGTNYFVRLSESWKLVINAAKFYRYGRCNSENEELIKVGAYVELLGLSSEHYYLPE